jgi:dTMP kinase
MTVRGKFIVLEGLDGSGTTTQAEILVEFLKKQGKDVVLTNEPTQGPIGMLVRLILSNRLRMATDDKKLDYLSDQSIALLFAADRLDHLQHTILPALEAGKWVVSDRYVLSSYAYNMGMDQKNFDWVRTINSKAIFPDLTLFLYTSVGICEERMRKDRWHTELYESPEILSAVEKNYSRAIKHMGSFHPGLMPIDFLAGNEPLEDVSKQVREKVIDFFDLYGCN